VGGKTIWLPKGETKVAVHEGKVTVWEEMVMTLQPVAKPTGFGPTPSVFKPGNTR
jgi:hypothetical protein